MTDSPVATDGADNHAPETARVSAAPCDVSGQLAAGDDYQLLITAPHDVDLTSSTGGPVTRIGRMTAEPEVRLDSARPWPRPGFDHFGGTP